MRERQLEWPGKLGRGVHIPHGLKGKHDGCSGCRVHLRAQASQFVWLPVNGCAAGFAKLERHAFLAVEEHAPRPQHTTQNLVTMAADEGQYIAVIVPGALRPEQAQDRDIFLGDELRRLHQGALDAVPLDGRTAGTAIWPRLCLQQRNLAGAVIGGRVKHIEQRGGLHLSLRLGSLGDGALQLAQCLKPRQQFRIDALRGLARIDARQQHCGSVHAVAADRTRAVRTDMACACEIGGKANVHAVGSGRRALNQRAYALGLHVQGADGADVALALAHFGLAQPALNVGPAVGLRRSHGAIIAECRETHED